MEATKTRIYLFFFVTCITLSDASSNFKIIGVESMEKLASGCDKFILAKDGMKEKLYDFYFSNSGDLVEFFYQLDEHLQREGEKDGNFKKLVDYFYICMNDASRQTLDQLKAFSDCPAFDILKNTEEILYRKLLNVAGGHLSDGRIFVSLKKELEDDPKEEKLSTCLSLNKPIGRT
ncbi:hypothetical protein JTB14_007816 [Gonioctena quinquepunctata]|nr:hypothetical protein JTB14_007816 [Gonioctena quinquepunctata]